MREVRVTEGKITIMYERNPRVMVRVSARLELTTVGVSKKTNYINGSLPTLVRVPGGRSVHF